LVGDIPRGKVGEGCAIAHVFEGPYAVACGRKDAATDEIHTVVMVGIEIVIASVEIFVLMTKAAKGAIRDTGREQRQGTRSDCHPQTRFKPGIDARSQS